MTDIQRRTLLKATMLTGLGAFAAAAGLLSPRRVMAAWPKNAFAAKKALVAVSRLFGSDSMTETKDIEITAPQLAENGAEVGISVRTKIAKADSITILAENNPTPLAVSFVSKPGKLQFVRTRLKIAKTTNINAVVRSEGKLYVAKFEVKVTKGGCGG